MSLGSNPGKRNLLWLMQKMTAKWVLESLLKATGSALSIEELRLLAEGQLAAPEPVDVDNWMALVAADLSDDLRDALRSFMASCKAKEIERSLAPAARVEALRAALSNQDLDGFLVPLSDEHQSEFPAKTCTAPCLG